MKFLVTIMVYTFAIFLLCGSAYSNPTPQSLNRLNLTKEYKIPPEIENFKYWFGDVGYGKIFYLGKEDIAGFEVELHLRFKGKKISSALVILGPAGLNSTNCLKRYHKIVASLNKKYGNFIFQKIIKDPIIDDLIPESVCDPVRLESYSIKTYWKLKTFTIISEILGDNKGFYIETEYLYSPRSFDNGIKKLLKLL